MWVAARSKDLRPDVRHQGMETAVLKPQGLHLASSLNEPGSRFFPRASSEDHSPADTWVSTTSS